MSVLQHHATHGFEPEHVEAALNSIEFRMREPPGSGIGLNIMFAMLSHWVYHG